MSLSPATKCRRGMTLVETMVYVAVGAGITSLAITTAVKAFRATDAVRGHAENMASLERLARQFRDDVHAATDATIEPKENQLVLSLPADRRVTYQAGADAFERTVRVGDATKERDTFSLSSPAPAGVEIHSEPAEAVLLLRAVPARQPQGEAAAGRTIAVRAMVGRDHRYERDQ